MVQPHNPRPTTGLWEGRGRRGWRPFWTEPQTTYSCLLITGTNFVPPNFVQKRTKENYGNTKSFLLINFYPPSLCVKCLCVAVLLVICVYSSDDTGLLLIWYSFQTFLVIRNLMKKFYDNLEMK